MKKETEEYYASIIPGERENFIPPYARAMDWYQELSLEERIMSEDHSIENYLEQIEEKMKKGEMDRDDYFHEKMGWQERQIRLQWIMKKRYRTAPTGRGFFLEPDHDEWDLP